jgi:hypothetical protein
MPASSFARAIVSTSVAVDGGAAEAPLAGAAPWGCAALTRALNGGERVAVGRQGIALTLGGGDGGGKRGGLCLVGGSEGAIACASMSAVCGAAAWAAA